MKPKPPGRELLQLISEGFVFIDRDFRVQEINEVGLRMARRPLADFIGRRLWDIAPHLEGSDLKRLWVDAMREGKPVSVEHFYRWTDGRESWLEMRGHPTTGGLAIFYRDITDKKRSEEELKRAQAELMHASRLSAMGTIAATLAHELAQPLTSARNAIAAGARMLRDVADPKACEAGEALDMARGAVQRAGDLLTRLRTFVAKGRVEKGTQDLAAIITDARALMLPEAQAQGVEIACKLDPEAKWVTADSVQVQQVLINLLRNAIEAMGDAGERRIKLTTAAAAPDLVEVRVEDSGPGLDPRIARAVFEPFKSSKEQGLGVGLSISRTIVEGHGGTIQAGQAPGGGALFRFTLRRAPPPEHTEPVQSPI